MGLNEADRLGKEGIGTKKGSVTKMPLYQLTLKRTGPTAHPRADLPPDEAMVQHIMKNGMRALTGEAWRFLVRDNGKGVTDPWPEIEIINGSRRDNAGMEAERRLREIAPNMPPLAVDKNDPDGPGRLFVEVELFNGSDAELILARLAANSEPGKLPDSIEVLALTVIQLTALGVDDAAEILKVMPVGTTKADVIALTRWKSLTDDARKVLVEANAPIYLLGQVLAVKRDDQAAMARKLVEGGAKTRLQAGKMAQREKVANGAARTFRFTPRSLKGLASHVSDAKVGSSRDRMMISAGLLIASGHDVDSVGLPPDMAQAVKDYQAQQKAEKPKKEKPKK